MWAEMFYLSIKKLINQQDKVCWSFMYSSYFNVRFLSYKTYKNSYSPHKCKLSVFYIRTIWYTWYISSDRKIDK